MPARRCRAEDLEVPRPLRLLLTAGWSLTESIGLPAAAYLAAARLDGRNAGLNAGLIAGLAAIWRARIRHEATQAYPDLIRDLLTDPLHGCA